jgi:hypothetical protein
MAGTLNRCYVNDDYPEENYIFKEAERERDRLELKEKEGSDLLETMRQKLIEGFDEMNIYPKPSNKDLVTNEIKEIININDLLNKRITEKCELKFREKRNQFLTRIAHCAEPKIGIVPSP